MASSAALAVAGTASRKGRARLGVLTEID